MSLPDRWDAMARSYEVWCDKGDTSDKVYRSAIYANRHVGRRDLDSYDKLRSMNDMIRDKRGARGAIELRGGGPAQTQRSGPRGSS